MTNESAETFPFELRAAEPADRPFWSSAWARSYRRSRWAGTVPNHLYFDVERTKVDGLLARGMRVHLAHVPGDPQALLGFVAWEPRESDLPHLVYLYVKDPYRRSGLGTQLLDATVGRKFLYSHRTDAAAFFQRPVWDVRFAPEIARRKDA